jgi:hypothetical protein
MLKCRMITGHLSEWRRGLCFSAWLALVCLASGCVGQAVRQEQFPRPFVMGEDSFAYRNDLIWVYYTDPNTGKWTHRPKEPKPDYTHHCFVVARSARQFFQHARFDPTQPVADSATYRKLIRKVVKTSPRGLLPADRLVVIPGYTNLYQFSQAHDKLLQAECGGAWQSYFQRGHWRIIFPYSGGHQQDTAEELMEALARNCPPVVHLVRFPSLTINHAVLVVGKKETPEQIQFEVYDPYQTGSLVPLTFDRKTRRFEFPTNDYFKGGRVDAYEVYCSWKY